MPIMIEFNYFSKFWVEGRLKVEFFDSHAHYDDEKFNEDREEIIEKIYNYFSAFSLKQNIYSCNRIFF